MSDLLPVLGRVTSGIYILTIGRGDRATGMLASWVMQAGFDPPMLTIAVKHGRYIADWLTAGEPFVVNVVGESHRQLLKRFAKGFEPSEPAFDNLETQLAANGVPALSQALGYLECQPSTHVDSADHRIFLASITGGALLSDSPPMIHIRKSGAGY